MSEITILIMIMKFLDTKPSIKISDLQSKNRLCNQIKKLSPLHQTSAIEAFHSVMIQFAPKSRAFSYKGMLARSGSNEFLL